MWFVMLTQCFCACIKQCRGCPSLGACVRAQGRWTVSRELLHVMFWVLVPVPPSGPFMRANNVFERHPGFLEPDFVISEPCNPEAFEWRGKDAAPALLF